MHVDTETLFQKPACGLLPPKSCTAMIGKAFSKELKHPGCFTENSINPNTIFKPHVRLIEAPHEKEESSQH